MNDRTYLIIPREPRYCPKYGTARRITQHSACVVRASDATPQARISDVTPWGTGCLRSMALLRLAHVAGATSRSPRRTLNQRRHGRDRVA